MRTSIFIFILIGIGFSACRSDFTPRPRGYFRIEFPEHSYEKHSADCPYAFDKPTYSSVEVDNPDSCWINIVFPQFGGKIYLTYKNIDNNLYQILEDSHELAFKHTIKADNMNSFAIENPTKNVYGMFYDIEGNVATPIQFYLTDSTKHYVRASLYFDVKPNKDSIAPVVDFFREDIEHMINTFEWQY